MIATAIYQPDSMSRGAMNKKYTANEIELVIKISKHCNLRCSYCYEFPFLGNKEVMAMSNMEKLFRNVASFRPTKLGDDDTFSFIWHGGEPFLIKMSQYREIAALQQSAIGSKVSYHNSVQTNLTILTDEQLEELQEKSFFRNVGFSFDVYGDQRVDARGRMSTDRVLNNLQKIRDRNISLGAIAVLSRSTLPHIGDIFRFYAALGINFRILPYHIETLKQQTELNGLRPDQIAGGMCEVFDIWLQSTEPVIVQPIEAYMQSALYYINNIRNCFYVRETDESVFIVNLDGETFGYETYLGEHRYGNLFQDTFEEIVNSPSRAKVTAKAAERVDKYCTPCRFYGACSGYPVSEAGILEEEWLKTSGCYVATIIAHMVERLEQTGLGTARPNLSYHPAASLGI